MNCSNNKKYKICILFVLFAVFLILISYAYKYRLVFTSYYNSKFNNKTVSDVVKKVGTDAEERLKSHFKAATKPIQRTGKQTVSDVLESTESSSQERLKSFFKEIDYPPKRIAILIFKYEKRLELWADEDGNNIFIKSYPILAASGTSRPKLKKGDRQVPEGFYGIEYLNPNSRYHLSMKLNYPNEFDKKMASNESRINLGGDIFIHGKNVSIGCIAVGDEAIEELFVLVAKISISNVKVIIAPNDLRKNKPLTSQEKINTFPWIIDVYENLQKELEQYK